MKISEQIFIDLLKSSINNDEYLPPFNKEFVGAVFNIAKNQRLLHIIYENAVKTGFLCENDEVYSAWKNEYILNKTRDIRQSVAYDEIKEILSKNSIKMLPLKGIIIKEFYPQSYYRRMSDLDILICHDDAKIVKDLLKSIGYTLTEDNGKHFIAKKKPGIIIEIHHLLFENQLESIFADVWKNAKSESENIFIMSDEDLVLHTVLHYGEHFLEVGLGIRAVVDIYILKKTFGDLLYSKQLSEKLEKAGFLKFYKMLLKVCDVCFLGKESTEEIDETIKYLFSSSVFGTVRNRATNFTISKTKNESKKKKRMFRILFPKYAEMCDRFSVLRKNPGLLPIFWAYRIIRAPFYTSNNVKVMKDLINVSTEDIDNRYLMLKNFGLENMKLE